MTTTRPAKPLFAAILLLLPVLYVGSYLTLVVPAAPIYLAPESYYRCGGEWSERAFYPLEWADRRVCWSKWNPPEQQP